MRVVKGMVQVAGTTYRVVRVSQGSYEVEIVAQGIEAGLMLEIAKAAIQGAKTSWVGRLSVA
jgi:hypothetical protein